MGTSLFLQAEIPSEKVGAARALIAEKGINVLKVSLNGYSARMEIDDPGMTCASAGKVLDSLPDIAPLVQGSACDDQLVHVYRGSEDESFLMLLSGGKAFEVEISGLWFRNGLLGVDLRIHEMFNGEDAAFAGFLPRVRRRRS